MTTNRDGQNCALCGYEIYDWQEDEYNVMDGLCPECSLTFSEEFAGYDCGELEKLAGYL